MTIQLQFSDMLLKQAREKKKKKKKWEILFGVGNFILLTRKITQILEQGVCHQKDIDILNVFSEFRRKKKKREGKKFCSCLTYSFYLPPLGI